MNVPSPCHHRYASTGASGFGIRPGSRGPGFQPSRLPNICFENACAWKHDHGKIITTAGTTAFDEAARLVARIAAARRPRAVDGLSGRAAIALDREARGPWLKRLEPNERLHALAGIRNALGKVN